MTSLVSIHNPNGTLAGAGVLVAPDLVLTCAHVVNTALGRKPLEPARPAAELALRIQFAGAPESRCNATIDPGADAWSAPPAEGAKGADLCLLQLQGQPPKGATLARLKAVPLDRIFPVLARGYPTDWNKNVLRPQVDAARGEILAVDGYLWLLRSDIAPMIVAALAKKRGAGLVYSGFSGGPVFETEDERHLVGLVASVRKDASEATAYVIPAAHFPPRILAPADAPPYLRPQPEMMLSKEDADRIANVYVREEIPDLCRSTLERIFNNPPQRGWRLDKKDKGQGYTDPEFNLKLIVKPPFIRLRPLQNRWLAYDYYHADLRVTALARAHEKTGDKFNDRKIRLASDFIGRGDVAIQETDYLSSLMTDQLAWTRVYSRKLSPDGVTPEHELWNGRSAFIDEGIDPATARLKGLGEALISNQLGASTLAFSSDGCLMIVVQSKENLQSESMLAPSGSGSLDWSDVAASKADDLLSLVRYGAERELREECALEPEGDYRRISSRVLVTGFARMCHRAGKPEFFCLGWIAAPSDEICDRRRERYVQDVLRAPVESAKWDAGRPKDEIIRVCEDYLNKAFHHAGKRIPLSYPLEHALQLLIEACRDDPAAAVLDRFMQDELE